MRALSMLPSAQREMTKASSMVRSRQCALKRVVLPVLQVADHRWRVSKVMTNPRSPRGMCGLQLLVEAGIFLQRQ